MKKKKKKKRRQNGENIRVILFPLLSSSGMRRGPEGLKKHALCCGMEDAGFCVGGSKVTTACSALLELSASEDLIGFKQAVEEDGSTIDEASFWYGGSSNRKMGFVQRMLLMIATLFGSIDVLKYIILEE
ncbi:Zinc finger CCCH domain-containing protein 66 [Nymphaea thermarum]|nr:Zinc finger CCCH domain-containing protein 66 [Nymphaea thermarum]